MPRILLFPLLVACHKSVPTDSPAATGRVTVLAMNDTYRLDGVRGGTAGGFGRVRALREQLEAEGRDVVVLHAGDLLYPSFMSRSFDGQQMVDGLNHLDGDAAAFDDRLFITFGNHEFDSDDLDDAALLDDRVESSGFTWVSSNVDFASDEGGVPLVAADNLRERVLLDVGGVRLGVFGLTGDYKRPEYVTAFGALEGVATEQVARLREAGADVVVGLTHLKLQTDLELLAALGEAGPDLVIGGHEHERHAEHVGDRWVLKADADAASVVLVDIVVEDGKVAITHEIRDLAGDVPAPDPALVALAASWTARHDADFCGGAGLPPGCLQERIGTAAVDLDAEELRIRRFETNLGDWVADRMLQTFAADGAQLAFVNSGSLRLNRDLAAGQPITRTEVEELFAYPSPMQLVAIDGATLRDVLVHATDDWTGSGHWLQVAGIAWRHDPTAEAPEARVADLTLLGPDGPRPIAATDRLLAVTVGFLLEPRYGQDGYTMLKPDMFVESPSAGTDLKDVVIAALRAAGEAGIAPAAEGRICNAQDPRQAAGPCLAMAEPR